MIGIAARESYAVADNGLWRILVRIFMITKNTFLWKFCENNDEAGRKLHVIKRISPEVA